PWNFFGYHLDRSVERWSVYRPSHSQQRTERGNEGQQHRRCVSAGARIIVLVANPWRVRGSRTFEIASSAARLRQLFAVSLRLPRNDFGAAFFCRLTTAIRDPAKTLGFGTVA